MDIITIIILAIIGIVVIWFIAAYNSFVTVRNRIEEAWADIDVQLKRRYDLIPNLVNTVKGYATHESATFDKVTNARSLAMQAGSTGEHAKAEGELSGALKSLFAVSEAYPDLKANQNFLELQKELTDTENKIQSARRFYNSNVRDFNTRVDVFPSSVIASLFSFKAREYFDLPEGSIEAEPVKVEF